jgi:O-antigen/teichoic acid export membrane protein
MDSSTKRRLAVAFLVNWISKLATVIIQLVQVPVFLKFWSVPLYGEWMIVTAVPSYLNISNMGFGEVAGNEMTMMMARDDREGALRAFQSCWWLIISICAACISLLATALCFFPAANLLRLHAISPTDTKWIIFYLGCSVLLGQLETLLQASYRCIARYAYGAFVKSAYSLIAFGIMIVPVFFHGGPRAAALAFALANVFFTIILCFMVRHDIPWIRFGWSHASFAEIRRLAAPAIAFMAFPVGNALNLQGTLMAVGYALGPTSVVVFGTARTVSRVALQMVQMVNNTFSPELSSSFGQKNIQLIRTLHRRACQIALFIALLIVLLMLTIGPWFLTHWTRGHVPPSRPLLAILLTVVAFYALWSTSSVLLSSTNQHQKLAVYYILGTSITIVFTYILAKHYGLYGAAGSLLISEIIMNIYVLPTSLRISHDTFSSFLSSMFTVPSSLKPATLLRRISRSKPELES